MSVPVLWQDYKKYLVYKAGRTQRYINRYERAFNTIKDYFKNKLFTENSVIEFLEHLQEKGNKNSTINNYLKDLHHIARIKKLPWLLEIKSLAVEQLHFDTFTPEEVEQILASNPKRQRNMQVINHRWNLIFATLFTTGMRRSEICSLKWSDIEDDRIWIQHTKGKRARMVKISPNLAILVNDLEKHEHGYVFGTYNGKLIDSKINLELKKRAQLCGIKKKVSSHTIRRSVATILAKKVNLRFIQELLGHKSIVTTAQYIQTDEEAIDACIRALPMNRDMINLQYVYTTIEKILNEFSPKFQYKVTRKKDSLSFFVKQC